MKVLYSLFFKRDLFESHFLLELFNTSLKLSFNVSISQLVFKMHDVVATKVVVHPLVLLSVVDHFNRMGKIGNQKRVVGVLLGSWRPKGVLDVSNSFAGKF